MRNARSFMVLSGLLALAAAGCSGGTTDSTASVKIHCFGGQAFCIISCDLGCSQTGCSVTEIAENQRLRWAFSDRVAVASVNSASISIRTATGVVPDGDFLVVDREVTFVPRVRTTNGISSFGFQRNETYIVTLAGGTTAAQGVTSVSGAALTKEFSCTVVASRGVQDEDQQAPTVKLTSPTSVNAAPVNPTIVLEFSELIDTTPLLSPLTNGSPIRVVLRGTLAGVCDRDAEGVAIEGVAQLSTRTVAAGEITREVSVVTFLPPVQLPGKSCITVTVTADLRDLSGRPAVPASFEILTVEGISTPITVSESFTSNAGFDPLISGGTWSNGAHPGVLGGDGKHGSFSHLHGTLNAAGEYVFNTDSSSGPPFVVTQAHSLLGQQQYVIMDGRFYFTDFVVPQGITVRFAGIAPPQIFVRGQADIRGTINISAADMPFYVGTIGAVVGQRVSTFNSRGVGVFALGQPGGAPGCGGGAGGAGAEECQSTGQLFDPFGVARFDGRSGASVQLQAGHAYGGIAATTGGRGSALWPASGLTVNTPAILTVYRNLFTPGGGGGGFSGPGGTASITPIVGMSVGPTVAGGTAFALVPTPPLPTPPPPFFSLNHFLVGGSGGGGGGSQPFSTFTSVAVPNVYQAGHGGSGGGGALAMRTGGDLSVAGSAVLLARGGAGVLINGDDPTSPTSQDINYGISSPGGGGSGGSFLLQSGTAVIVNGTIDTGGGAGSRTGAIVPTQINFVSQAGAGAPGFYRLEAPGSGVNFFGTGTPAFVAGANNGVLTDTDSASGCTSTWRSSGQFFPPIWLRYELDVDTDGDGTIDITYTDATLAGPKANDPNGPVVILFQGARLNQAGTQPLPGEAKPWREGIGSGAGPGIGLDSPTGFRFMLTYNQGLAPNLVVRALRVYART